MSSSVYDTYEKLLSKYLELREIGNEYFKKSSYNEALISYTNGLIYAPVLDSETSKEIPVSISFANRSAAHFRLKNYEQSVLDITQVFKNGKTDINKYFKLMNRLAWSYWHLKNFSKCEEVIKEITETSQEYENTFNKEMEILKSLLDKLSTMEKSKKSPKVNLKDQDKVLNNKKKLKNGVSSDVKIFSNPAKGRHLKATSDLKAGDLIIKEKCFCGILNFEFMNTYCNYCYKDCRATGIPCYGCTSALFCDEICKNLAWKKYHWLECSIWPLISKIDIFAILSLRIVLKAAYELTQKKYESNNNNKTQFDDGSKNNVFKFILNKIITSFESCPKQNFDDIFNEDYISVLSLLTHSEDVSLKTKTNSLHLAWYLAKIVTMCVKKCKVFEEIQDTENKIFIQNIVSSCFEKLSLNFWMNQEDFEIEKMRSNIKEVCQSFDESEKDLNTKDIHIKTPRSFHEMLTYLLNHHLLQLLTNTQAIFQTVEEKSSNHSTNVTQKRIASAVFPNLSLLNHSCDPNTFVNFHGNTVKVKLTTKLKKDDEIFHCYGPCVTGHSYTERQNMLKTQYYFKCDCTACNGNNTGDSDLQAYQQQFTAYKCKYCSGPCAITESKSGENKKITGICLDVKCKKSLNLTSADNEFFNIMNQMNEVRTMLSKTNLFSCIITLLKFLEKLKRILYHNHRALGSIHDLIGFCYTETEQFKLAIPHIQQSVKITCMRFGSKSIEAAREFFKLTTLQEDFSGQYIFVSNLKVLQKRKTAVCGVQVHICDYKQAQFYLNKCFPTLKLNLDNRSLEWKNTLKVERQIECGIKLNMIN